MNGNDEIGHQGCVIVFTCRGRERMLREGGSQSWRMNASRASKCKYVVCVQNRNETWGQASAPHKHAFLIAEISQITESPESPGRQAIKFKSFADIDVPDSWDGNRNPVAYGHLRDFGINTLDDLEDLPFTRLGSTLNLLGEPELIECPGDDYQAAAAVCDQAVEHSGDSSDEPVPLSFEEAKLGLALRYGVLPEQIEILIKV